MPGLEVVTLPDLGPRPSAAASYFKRTNPRGPARTEPESDLLKVIKQVIRPSRPRHMRHTQLYPCHENRTSEGNGREQELSWNNNCVVWSVGGVIQRKWTFESEGQDIQWACRGYIEEPGRVAEGFSGTFASSEAGPSTTTSSTTFSRFAQSAKARQRAEDPPMRVPAVYIFLRNLGKIYVDGGGDYTFHVPFLVQRAWPIHPHGVLIQRQLDQCEIHDAVRADLPVLPSLFSLHDPFAEPKVVAIAAKIHGALGHGIATNITPVDPFNPPETKTPDDFSASGGYKPTSVRTIQTEPPPPPPKPDRPFPLQKLSATDTVLWVSEQLTSASILENIVVTCSSPVSSPRPPTSQATSTSTSDTPDAKPDSHKYAHQMHLTVWRYAYHKPREVPDTVTSRRKRTQVPSENMDQQPDRRDLQDRADRIAPSSPDLIQPVPGTGDSFRPPVGLQPSLSSMPVGAQPTLTSLPGGELPPSWGAGPKQGTERRSSSLSVTMDRMVLEAGEAETFMSASHMEMQPSIWFEKVAVLPIPYNDMRRPENITVHLFDTRSDFKLERSLLAVHFPGVSLLSVYTLARIPAADTLRIYPAVNMQARSAASISALRGAILDLLIVKMDGTLALLTHGIRMLDVGFSAHRGLRVAVQQEDDDDDAMSVDGHSDKSDASMIDKEKIVRLSQPLNSAVTLHFEDGRKSRTRFTYLFRDTLTALCFWSLSYALTSQRAFTLHLSWLAKWNRSGTEESNEVEWKCFVDALCDMVDVRSPYQVELPRRQLSPWEKLAYSSSAENLEHDAVLRSLDAPFRSYGPQYPPPTKKPHEDIVPCLLALHTLGESLKLKTDAASGFLPRLAKLLIALGRAARPEWADHWVRLFPDNAEGWADPKRQDNSADSRLRPQTPDIYAYLFTRLVESSSKPSWTTLPHISHLFQFEPAMQFGRVEPMKDLYRLFSVWECFADASVPTARKRAENAMLTMVRLGMTNDELDRMPYGIVQPIREALRTCQSLGGDWPAQAYQLAHRPDLAQMVYGDNNHTPSRDSFRQVDKHLDTMASRTTVGELIEGAQAAMSPDPSPPSGVELDLGDFTDIRFGSDRRLQEVARMLQSSSPATVKMPERHDMNDHEVAREQQTTALRVAERTLALPVGRAMFTFGTVPTVTRDAYRIPKMDFSVRLQPYNAVVGIDVTKVSPEAKNWADFHNGVATGLRMSPSSRTVDSSWITFNKPTELTAEHAGFLFGLGLSGHLKNMMTWHTFSYLTPKHDLTSIGVLLGLSAANIGTANRHVTKLLAVHTPALLPNPTVDLNVPMLTQASGLVGIGLLYTGTRNRRMAEVALHEISRTQVTSADQTTDFREAYSFSAAMAFGMIMLAAGANDSSPADMNIVSRLRLLIHGEPMLLGSKNRKPSFDVSLTSAPSTLALALMFLRTGRRDIADILAVPSTLLELHHLQPSFLLVRTLGRALILWDQIVATPQWVTDQLPKSALEALEKRMVGKPIDESQELAYFNIVSGACFAMGLKYAGTAQEDPYSCLVHFHDLFTRISNQNSGQFDHRIKRAAVRDGLNLISLALAMVMAGTGEINCLRRFRFSHGQATQPSRYGVHMATHMSIGLLFLGGGRYTLGTSDSAIACLIAAFYPRFPSLSHENRGHLQALRHLWALAVEPRCLMGRDVDSNEVVYLPVKVKLTDGRETRGAQLISPTLFPDINRLLSIRVDTPRYFPFYLDIAHNPRHRDVLLRNQTLWVKRRTGHLGYGEDPRGSRSIYIRSGASSGDAAVLDNPKPSDACSSSATEFFQFISSFSNEAFFVAFADRFCRPDGTDDTERVFAAFSHAAMLECLTLDRPHVIPTYLHIHLTRYAPLDVPALALRDLAWLDEFYKNIYDARFSGKGDSMPMPPLMRRSLLLAAERAVDKYMAVVRTDPDVREALRRYHRGEGVVFRHETETEGIAHSGTGEGEGVNGARVWIASSSRERDRQVQVRRRLGFYLGRTNVPPAGVLVQIREEAMSTLEAVKAGMLALNGEPNASPAGMAVSTGAGIGVGGVNGVALRGLSNRASSASGLVEEDTEMQDATPRLAPVPPVPPPLPPGEMTSFTKEEIDLIVAAVVGNGAPLLRGDDAGMGMSVDEIGVAGGGSGVAANDIYSNTCNMTHPATADPASALSHAGPIPTPAPTETEAEHADTGALARAQETALEATWAVRGLVWNTGVLFAGGMLRPWTMRALEEVVRDW